MAKIRLDWFKLDCQMDSKMDLIESEFGLYGFAVIVKLFQMIYGGEGYYCEWNDDIALVFARRNNVGANAVSDIVKRAIARGIFDKSMYEKYGILTSHGIQVRYCEAVDRRKFSKLRPEYLLLCNTQKTDNADISSKNVNISDKNADIFSTEKKRREKKRIEENRQTESEPDFTKVELTQAERDELVRLSDSLSVDRYIKNLSDWQQQHRVLSKKAFVTIKGFIEEDKPKRRSQAKRASDGNEGASYDIAEWQDFCENFDPSRIGGEK